MNRLRHLLHRSGHHMWRVLMTMNILCLVMQFAPIPDRAKSVVLAAAIVAVGAAFCFGSLVHESSLCEPCIAEMPLNGPELAEKRERWLAAFHWMFRNGWLRWLLVLVVWWGYNFSVSRLFSDDVSTVLTFIPATLSILLIMRHHRVYPWCKRCHWRGGGSHEAVAPTPDPAVSR